MKDYNLKSKRIKEIDKLMDETEKALGVLSRASRKVGKSSDFKLSGLVGRNFLGDVIRSSKNNSINKSIDRVQDTILDLHSKLMLFDPKLASILDLPYKMTQYGGAHNPISDMKLRIDMRKKKFDIERAQTRLVTLMKRLAKERVKEINKVKHKLELSLYED